MPTENYNGTDVTHIIATTNRTQGGITIVNGERYGIDHFWAVSRNWWRIALDGGFARIMLPEEYPEPNFTDGRLKRHKVFSKMRVLVINTTNATRTQLRQLLEQDDVYKRDIIFNRNAQDETTRIAVAMRIKFDDNGDVIIPNWITNNPTIIINTLSVHQAKQILSDNTNVFLLDGSVSPDDIDIVTADGNVTGRQALNYIKRLT